MHSVWFFKGTANLRPGNFASINLCGKMFSNDCIACTTSWSIVAGNQRMA